MGAPIKRSRQLVAKARSVSRSADLPEERGYAKGRHTRRNIVEVASRLFAVNGYRETTFDQIAAAAGMTKGAVSGHYKRKRDLYLAAMKYGLSFFQELSEIGVDLPPEEGLTRYLHWLGEHLSADSDARALLIQLMRDPEDDIRIELIGSLLTEPFARIRRHIEGINSCIDSAAYSFIVFSSLLLDADQHHFHTLMAEDKGRSHDMSATIRRLVGVIKTAKEH